jgi:hypothetical protein
LANWVLLASIKLLQNTWGYDKYNEEAEAEHGKRREGRLRRCSSTKVKKILKNFVPWQHSLIIYFCFSFPLRMISAFLLCPIYSWCRRLGSGAGRSNTKFGDVERDGSLLLVLGWDLSGVEGGRKVGLTFEKIFLCIVTWLKSYSG